MAEATEASNTTATVAPPATTEEEAELILEDRIKRLEVEMDQKELAFRNSIAKADEGIKRMKKLLDSILRPTKKDSLGVSARVAAVEAVMV